jgi:hypothetical protein
MTPPHDAHDAQCEAGDIQVGVDCHCRERALEAALEMVYRAMKDCPHCGKLHVANIPAVLLQRGGGK